jgi:hypothetical protein
MGSCSPTDGDANRSQESENPLTATANTTDVTQLVDRYIEIWNETDATARRALIARTWTEDGRYLDPQMSGEGHDGIDAMIGALQAHAQAQFPGFRFRRTSDVDAHNDRIRFTWEVGPEGGEPLAGGVDFGVVSDGRLQSITGFQDFSPSPAE